HECGWPWDSRTVAAKRRRFRRWSPEKLLDRDARRERPGWFQSVNERHGNHDAASPRRHFVDIEREPERQQHQLRRDCGCVAQVDGAKHCQIEADVGICRLKAAQLVDSCLCPEEMRSRGGIASETKRNVSFYGGIQLGWASRE